MYIWGVSSFQSTPRQSSTELEHMARNIPNFDEFSAMAMENPLDQPKLCKSAAFFPPSICMWTIWVTSPRLDVLELSSTFAEARELNWWFHASDFHPNIGMVDTMPHKHSPSTPTHTYMHMHILTDTYIVLHIRYGHTCTFLLTTHVNIYIYSNIYIYVGMRTLHT